MKTETITITKLVASEGMILTDGEIYGVEIYPAKNRTADEFHEITLEEHDEILKAQMAEDMSSLNPDCHSEQSEESLEELEGVCTSPSEESLKEE